MSGLRINISKLSEGIHNRSLEVEPGDFGLDERFTENVKVQATLEKSTKQLYLTVELSTGGMFTCDRCLDEHHREVRAKYGMVYMFGSEVGVKSENQEVAFIHPDTSFIEIGEDVRQYAILAIPPKILCKEDCEGLCPRCGINRNRATCQCVQDDVDPRWQGLRKFLEN